MVTLGASDGIEHGPSKGDASELNWRDVLKEFLPKRYTVSLGAFVIDKEGNQSEAVDLVVHDAHFCPLFFDVGGHIFIPAESVYATFEIKQELTRDDVLYAAKKAASVRKLIRTSGDIVHAGGVFKAKEESELFTPLAGILTRRSSWSEPIGASLEKALLDADIEGKLDLGCALEHGAFDATYDDNVVTLARSEEDAGLLFFLMHLFNRLQTLGSVPRIDLTEYASEIEVTDDH